MPPRGVLCCCVLGLLFASRAAEASKTPGHARVGTSPFVVEWRALLRRARRPCAGGHTWPGRGGTMSQPPAAPAPNDRGCGCPQMSAGEGLKGNAGPHACADLLANAEPARKGRALLQVAGGADRARVLRAPARGQGRAPPAFHAVSQAVRERRAPSPPRPLSPPSPSPVALDARFAACAWRAG